MGWGLGIGWSTLYESPYRSVIFLPTRVHSKKDTKSGDSLGLYNQNLHSLLFVTYWDKS
jgi:hypothetical protein